jgi:oligopeptide transport system substrate-binding protein
MRRTTMNSSKKFLFWVLSFVLIGSMVAGCAPKAVEPVATAAPAQSTSATEAPAAKPTDAPKPTDAVKPVPAAEKVLKIGIGGEEDSFDPATGTTANPQYIIKVAYRGLFSFAEDGQLKNEVCTDYKVSDDGLIYTFKLREDAKWSDGVPVTANDFVYGFRRELVPELKAAYADMMSAIVNFDDCFAGTKPLEEFGVKAVDDYTFEVTLSYPQPYFPLMTTFSPFFPLREDKVPMDSTNWSRENVADIVTNGPLKFSDYVPNEKIVLVPNPESYEFDKVKLSRIEFYFIPDPQTQVAAFKTGEIDMAFVPPQDVSMTYANKEEIKKVPYLANNIYLFSSRVPVFEDIRVREAINIAINRAQIAEILGGANHPLYALIPPGVTNPATGKDFREEGGDLIVEDVAKAQQLLADAGYPGGKGFPEISWLYNNLPMHNDISQAVQAMLKDNLGITLKLQSLDSATFSSERRAGNFEITRLGTSADYVDPTTWLNLYISSTGYIQRVSGYSTPKYDELMEESNKLLDPGPRFEKLHEAEKELVNQFWWIPISTYNKEMLQKDYVKGVFTTTAGDIFMMYADIVK